MHSPTSMMHQVVAGHVPPTATAAALRFTRMIHGPEGPLGGYSYRATWRFL